MPQLDRLDPYLSPKCNLAMLELFGIRSRILAAINARVPQLHGTLLDVGCGYMPYKGTVTSPPSQVCKYIGMDLPSNIYLNEKVDLIWDGSTIPLPDGSVDCALATEVFEHCPMPEHVMSEIARVLRPGGRLLLTVPFVWPLHEVPHDEYRYTPFSLERHLRNAAFVDIEIEALGGWDAAFAQMIGLWVKYRGFSDINRWVLNRLALPIVRFLSGRDRPPRQFKNTTMMIGLTAWAAKGPL